VAVDERDPGTAPGREGQARSAPGRPTRLFSVSTPVADYPSLACPLSGNHQRNNALIAIRAAEVLAERLTLGLDTQAVREGIATTRWPGRLEWVAGAPALLLDGAHNPAGCRALADYLVASGLRPVLLFAAMHDKEIEPMLASLLPHVSACVFTAPPSPRAADPDALVDLARKVYRGLGPPTGAAMEMSPIHHPVELLLVADGGRFLAERDVAGALGRARRLAGARGTVLAAGSLFLVGAVKEVLLGLPVRAGEGA
jgi:dihydrofolate synthase/folylpolyglutamate synthase